MPRSLTRLRWRNSAPQVALPRLALPKASEETEAAAEYARLERRVGKHVDRLSKPQPFRLQTVLNSKARPPPTGRSVVPPPKPYTLRDVVDPLGKAQHGEIIYVFRNTETNQIIYSLQELLDNHHLEQLPFISKHSKPPALRPDSWVPHCVITFPTAAQGHNAFRKLREFRHLHELSWEKTNPEYKKIEAKQRMKKIMDQRANMSADLAAVLRIQYEQGAEMRKIRKERDEQANEWMEKRWKSIHDMASAAAVKGEKLTDSIKWLEHQERSLSVKLNMKHNQNEADQKRLLAAREGITTRLRKVRYAVRKAEQLKEMEGSLTKVSAPARQEGAAEELSRLQEEAETLEQSLSNPDSVLTAGEMAADKERLDALQIEIAALVQAFDAKHQLDQRTHFIAQSVLPRHLRKSVPAAYTLEGVRILWADLQDAMHARGKWHNTLEHEPLVINTPTKGVAFLSAEDFAAERQYEIGRIMNELQKQQATEQAVLEQETVGASQATAA